MAKLSIAPVEGSGTKIENGCNPGPNSTACPIGRDASVNSVECPAPPTSRGLTGPRVDVSVGQATTSKVIGPERYPGIGTMPPLKKPFMVSLKTTGLPSKVSWPASVTVPKE